LQGVRKGPPRGLTNAVLVGDHLPELGADLIATLAALDSHELTHLPVAQYQH
tara:strand:+ start:123 stop:278 length:156 start_codon:yes stop_codon:yes gene_type:complete